MGVKIIELLKKSLWQWEKDGYYGFKNNIRFEELLDFCLFSPFYNGLEGFLGGDDIFGKN